MTELEDGMVARDLLELGDVSDRVLAEEMLSGRRDWPLTTMLPVKRVVAGEEGLGLELGVVRRDHAYGPVEPVVRGDGPVRARRYSSVTQLVDAGWRVD